jgi:hypothetical protein
MLNLAVLILGLGAASLAQNSPAVTTKPLPVPLPAFEVKFEPDPQLSVPFDESGYPAVFAEGCDDTGNPYVQVDRTFPPHSIEVLKFDPKGIVTFETSKITDIAEPKWIADFVSDSTLYMLIEGDAHTEQVTRKPEWLNGKEAVSWETKGEPHYYIAQFDPDGSYKGASKLDLPFRPTRLSGFRSGSFLTTGLDDSKKLRVALLDSRGQLLRYIEFPKEKQEAAEKIIERSFSFTESPDSAPTTLAGLASFFPHQGNVLYVRSRSGAPIYEITAGGEAKAVKIKSPEGYAVEYLLPSDRNWFVVSTEQGKYSGAKSMIYEINPASGEFLGRYVAEGSGRTKAVSEGQSDLACFHEGEFISVRHQNGKLTVLRGTPVPAQAIPTAKPKSLPPSP